MRYVAEIELDKSLQSYVGLHNERNLPGFEAFLDKQKNETVAFLFNWKLFASFLFALVIVMSSVPIVQKFFNSNNGQQKLLPVNDKKEKNDIIEINSNMAIFNDHIEEGENAITDLSSETKYSEIPWPRQENTLKTNFNLSNTSNTKLDLSYKNYNGKHYLVDLPSSSKFSTEYLIESNNQLVITDETSNTYNTNVEDDLNIDNIGQLPVVVSYISSNRNNPLAINAQLIDSYPGMRRLSFGFIYSFGKSLAVPHMTPFTSPFDTRIEGGSAYGFGLNGMYILSSNHALRTSFTYNVFNHKMMIDSLLPPGGLTQLFLNSKSHELKLGFDYMHTIKSSSKGFDLYGGVGVAYHHMIAQESNNYIANPDLQEIVENLNEADIDPVSIRVFMNMEKRLTENIVIGIEPYLAYHGRHVNYEPSIALADMGDYNFNYGINLTMRFD